MSFPEIVAKLQETLLFEILRGKKLKVTNVDKGVTMIKKWLRGSKVLLVLDDVDDMEQLHKLVGACDWFGVGSRIIITTRDKQLLIAHRVNSIYEVKKLDDDKALELFCWHAFKTSGPPLGDYVKLAERAMRYAQGLPLALIVLGTHLCGGSIDKWEAALEGFKNPKIQDVLTNDTATWVEWAFLLTALCLEILSLCFDQATSPSQPQYALFGMILAIAAVLICIWDLICKGKRKRVVLRRWGRLWWFYYPDPPHTLFGTVLDFYGLAGGIAQCICSTVQYVFFLRHADNPIKASLWPAIFVICLGAKRLSDSRNEIHRD